MMLECWKLINTFKIVGTEPKAIKKSEVTEAVWNCSCIDGIWLKIEKKRDVGLKSREI